ncbi:hypothetical protein B0O99DRAFT_710280 [Bisporella sp. PMI_857]|nr:hypothetical protein B0O99DRAFT_710280 [Bisporella sp. PMI_857]
MAPHPREGEVQSAETVNERVGQPYVAEREGRAAREHRARGVFYGEAPPLDVALRVQDLGARVARDQLVEEETCRAFCGWDLWVDIDGEGGWGGGEKGGRYVVGCEPFVEFRLAVGSADPEVFRLEALVQDAHLRGAAFYRLVHVVGFVAEDSQDLVEGERPCA